MLGGPSLAGFFPPSYYVNPGADAARRVSPNGRPLPPTAEDWPSWVARQNAEDYAQSQSHPGLLSRLINYVQGEEVVASVPVASPNDPPPALNVAGAATARVRIPVGVGSTPTPTSLAAQPGDLPKLGQGDGIERTATQGVDDATQR
jgi:hypothetical protein